MSTPASILSPQSTMREALEIFPGAQRALFKGYHIGGCSSCAFRPDETIAQLCERNGNLDAEEMIEHLRASQQHDESMEISPIDLAARLRQDNSIKLLDIRAREEWDAGRVEGGGRMSQETMQEIFGKWPRE